MQENTTSLLGELTHNVSSIMHDILTPETWMFVGKLFVSVIVGTASYLFGAEGLSLLYALIVLVLLEFVVNVVGELRESNTGGTIWCLIKSIENPSLAAAVQLGAYSVIAAAANVTEQAVIGETFLMETTLTFLALTQFVRILKAVAVLGVSVPSRLIKKVESLAEEIGGPTDNSKKKK